MIYLTRTTIEFDGTCTTETAVLEDGARLNAYRAQGWREVAWPAFLAAWRATTDAIMEQLIAAAWMRSRFADIPMPMQDVCRYCHAGPIVRPAGATPWCRRCKRPQVDDAKQR